MYIQFHNWLRFCLFVLEIGLFSISRVLMKLCIRLFFLRKFTKIQIEISAKSLLKTYSIITISVPYYPGWTVLFTRGHSVSFLLSDSLMDVVRGFSNPPLSDLSSMATSHRSSALPTIQVHDF